MVLLLNLSRFDAGDRGPLYDVSHRAAVHRDIAFAHPLRHRILERTVSAFDDDGVPRLLDCSDLFRDCHMKTPSFIVFVIH